MSSFLRALARTRQDDPATVDKVTGLTRARHKPGTDLSADERHVAGGLNRTGTVGQRSR